jgi:hypothetical protein
MLGPRRASHGKGEISRASKRLFSPQHCAAHTHIAPQHCAAHTRTGTYTIESTLKTGRGQVSNTGNITGDRSLHNIAPHTHTHARIPLRTGHAWDTSTSPSTPTFLQDTEQGIGDRWEGDWPDMCGEGEGDRVTRRVDVKKKSRTNWGSPPKYFDAQEASCDGEQRGVSGELLGLQRKGKCAPF